MAEIVGFSASIITVLELCTKSLKLLRDIKDAPKEYKRLHMAICATKGVVDELQETIANAEAAPHNVWLKTIPSLIQDGGPLGCLQETLTSLTDQLDRATSAEGIKRVGKKLYWPIKKDDIKTTIRVIKMQQKILMLAFQNDSLILTQEIHNGVKIIHEDARIIREDTRVVRKDIEKVGNGLDMLTITSEEGLRRIEGEIKSSQENRKKLEELYASIKQSVARHNFRDIFILHRYQRTIAYDNNDEKGNDEEEEEGNDDKDNENNKERDEEEDDDDEEEEDEDEDEEEDEDEDEEEDEEDEEDEDDEDEDDEEEDDEDNYHGDYSDEEDEGF